MDSEELEGCICMEELIDPRALPCLHSFCHSCLCDYIRRAKYYFLFSSSS
jgi:hypothetical protein